MKRRHHRKPFALLEWAGRRTQKPSAANLQLQIEAYPAGVDHTADFGGQLILGDNLTVMAALLPEWEERIDLIYADPPFLTGKAYAARIGRGEDSRRPSEWHTVDGYRDTWINGAAYLDMLHPRLQLMYQLLSPSGTLYLHLDWHASAYARILLDEIFGPDRLLNEIVWIYHGPSPIRSAFKRKHDTILVYTKSKDYTFNADAVRVAYNPSTVKTFASSPKAGFGKVPDLARGKVPEDWWYFPVVARLHKERSGYPTQKPEALLQRIILASSNPDEVVADFFCGSGTTPVVADRLGRRWLACDQSPPAIHTTYRRFMLKHVNKPFTVWKADEEKTRSSLQLLIALSQSGAQITMKLEGLQSDKASPDIFPENLVLWEVDWDYDRRVFCSQSQAVRPWREDFIDLQLGHTYDQPGTHTLCIRASDSQSRSGLTTRKIKVSF